MARIITQISFALLLTTVCCATSQAACNKAYRQVRNVAVRQSAPVQFNGTLVLQKTTVTNIEKVEAKAKVEERPTAPTGAKMTIFSNFLGGEPGYAVLKMNKTTIQCRVSQWRNGRVTLELPVLGLDAPQDATVSLIAANGRIVKSVKIRLVNPPDHFFHGEAVRFSLK